jgi:hypothetical protein
VGGITPVWFTDRADSEEGGQWSISGGARGRRLPTSEGFDRLDANKARLAGQASFPRSQLVAASWLVPTLHGTKADTHPGADIQTARQRKLSPRWHTR